VLRGGSWLNDTGNARCAFRYRNYPDYRVLRDDFIGFRVLSALPIR
jgi:formylglycine-generating enzyme required for sulfatase activity